MRRASMLALCALLLLNAPAIAGGRGGHNTTFDPNSYGGGWACFVSQLSGKCGSGTFAHYSNAACDGVTSDASAEADFRTWAYAQNPALVKLYVPPGLNCNIQGCLAWACTASTTDTGVKNLLIWAYGSTFPDSWFGGGGLWFDNSKSALFHTNSVGDATVNLVTVGDGAIFSVGDWVMTGGLSVQTASSPANNQLYEYRAITGKSACTITCVITLSSPLQNSYLETWPLTPSSTPANGPATLFWLQPSWNINYTVLGLTVTNPNSTQAIGRSVKMYDTSTTQTNPSTLMEFWSFYSNVGGVEVDKNILFAEYFRTVGRQYLGQNPSPLNVVLDSTTWSGSIAGIGANVSILNSKIGTLKVGPAGGAGGTFLLSNSAWAAIQAPIGNFLLLTWVSYSNGVFSIPLTSPQYNGNAVPWGVPGAEYGMADSDGTINSVPLTTFKVTGVTSDGTNAYYATGSWVQAGSSIATPATLPTPTCNSHACFAVTAYPGTSLVERFIGSSTSQQQFFPVQ